MNFRIVSFTLGYLILGFCLGFAALIPFAIWFREWKELIAILESIGISALAGGIFVFIGRNHTLDFFRREAIAVTGLAWSICSVLGALPFYLGGMTSSFVDAVFESTSGLTTTGGSILVTIEDKAGCLLVWRSFLHFMGGLGIIVFFIALMPGFNLGGKTLFKQEVAGPVVEGLTPKIRDTAIRLIYLYLGLNAFFFVLLLAAGLSAFDAFNHAISTVATGGFSNRDDSCASFPPLAQWIIIFGMLACSSNFTLHLELLKGNWRAYWRNTEFRTFTGIALLASTIVAVLLYAEATNAVTEWGEWNFRDAAFAVASVFSTTGFGTVDFDQWPDACRYVLAMLMLSGGMVGSTAGGFKVIRFVILCKAIRQEVNHEISPREVLTLKVDKRPLSQEIVRGVLGYLAIYVVIILIGGFAVTVFDPHLSLVSAFSASISCFNSIGPGLDEVGPAGNFSAISPSSKLLLSVFMLLGRLEIYPIIMLFSSRFWFPK